MMMRARLLILVATAGASSACSQYDLKPLGYGVNQIAVYATATANFCTSPPTPTKENLKYVFVLDHSASNQPGFFDPADVSNTDPQGARRYGPLVNFVQGIVDDPLTPTSFALIDFSDASKHVGSVTGFNPSKSSFLSDVNCDWLGQDSGCAAPTTPTTPTPSDGGFTNYVAAISNAQQIIQDDATQAAALGAQPPVSTRYVVIFVTDGLPKISDTVTQDMSSIGPAIDAMMSVATDPRFKQYVSSITFNAAYYAQDVESLSAENLLTNMSDQGQGQFIKFLTGANVLYQRFAPPSRNLRNVLTDAFIDDENAVWWQDGTFLGDTDGDGLPDMIEAQLGSNPGVRDSDGNGVSDLVEYRTKGRACDAAGCSQAGRDPYAICAGFSPTRAADGSVTFASTSNDGLNDCEKFLLSGDRTTFNTNGDFIPDFLAFKYGLPIALGTADAAFADPFRDGVMNYAKVKSGLPTQVSQSSLSAFSQRSMTIVATDSPSPDISCYRLTARKIALAGSGDSIRVMLIQNDAAATNKPFMVQARARVQSGGVAFGAADFN